jgi:hypothetical protein
VDVDTLLACCLAKPGAWPDNPWDDQRPVVEVGTTREVADEWLHRYPDDASATAYLGRSGWDG